MRPPPPRSTRTDTLFRYTTLFRSGGDKLAHHLHDDVGVIRYAPPELVLKAESPHLADLPRNLAALLKEQTRTSWMISYGEGEAAPSIREQEIGRAHV